MTQMNLFPETVKSGGDDFWSCFCASSSRVKHVPR